MRVKLTAMEETIRDHQRTAKIDERKYQGNAGEVNSDGSGQHRTARIDEGGESEKHNPR